MDGMDGAGRVPASALKKWMGWKGWMDFHHPDDDDEMMKGH